MCFFLSLLAAPSTQLSPAIRLHSLANAITSVEKELWEKKGHVPRRRNRTSTQLLRDYRRAKAWKRKPTSFKKPIDINDQTVTTDNIDSILQKLKQEVNKQARIRKRLRQRIFVKNRSQNFMEPETPPLPLIWSLKVLHICWNSRLYDTGPRCGH